MNIELIIFIIYLALLIGIGLFFYARTTSIEGFLLGDRGLGSWVTAISAQASDMSGWLLMGLPGAIYLGGIAEIWIGIGLFLGTVVNWLITASRLRVYTEKVDALTLSTFLNGVLRTQPRPCASFQRLLFWSFLRPTPHRAWWHRASSFS